MLTSCTGKGQYVQALENYKAASKIQPNDPTYWNKMAACYERLGNYEKMAVAARNTITVDKQFIQGYHRLAVAQRELGELNNCRNTVDYGLAIRPSNEPLLQLKKDLQRKDGIKGERERKPNSYRMKNVSKTKVAPVTPTGWARKTAAGGANTTTRSAPPVKKTTTTTTPATAKSGVITPEEHKKRGDAHYKSGEYKNAIEDYTKALNGLPYNQRSLFVSKVLNCRATCYFFICYHNDAIADCSTILEKLQDTQNARARVQRAKAYEKTKQYIKASKDAKYVLNDIPPAKAGHSNREECNQIITRCQRASIANLS